MTTRWTSGAQLGIIACWSPVCAHCGEIIAGLAEPVTGYALPRWERVCALCYLAAEVKRVAEMAGFPANAENADEIRRGADAGEDSALD